MPNPVLGWVQRAYALIQDGMADLVWRSIPDQEHEIALEIYSLEVCRHRAEQMKKNNKK